MGRRDKKPGNFGAGRRSRRGPVEGSKGTQPETRAGEAEPAVLEENERRARRR